MTDKHLNFKITLKLDVCTEMTQQGLESHIGQLLKDSTLCDISVDGLHIQNTRLCDCDCLEHLKNEEE